MRGIRNKSVQELLGNLLKNLREYGYSKQTVVTYTGFARLLSAFMEQRGIEDYNESVGVDFYQQFCQTHARATSIKMQLFLVRLDSIKCGSGFIRHIRTAKSVELPDGLNSLLCFHRQRCIDKGLRPSSVQTHERYCREFLLLLAEEGVLDSSGFTASSISKACFRYSSQSCYSVIRLFLRYVFEEGKSDRDYSVLVPKFRSPQPMPSVYSEEELRKIEAAIDRNTLTGKRDYAIVLLTTRLGIRPGNIANMTLKELNFQSETLHFTQQKTGVPITLPMVPELKDALLDYIQNARESVCSEYVFLSRHPPHAHLSIPGIGDCIRRAIQTAKIDVGQRQWGPRAMRSSVASSMVNDSVPYEVVRRTLGHTGKNAIKSYAKLDIEQLKLYSLEPPAATGKFAELLAGKWV